MQRAQIDVSGADQTKQVISGFLKSFVMKGFIVLIFITHTHTQIPKNPILINATRLVNRFFKNQTQHII